VAESKKNSMEVYEVLHITLDKSTQTYTVTTSDNTKMSTDNPLEVAQVLAAHAVGILKTINFVDSEYIKSLTETFKKMELLHEQTA